jgi:hypothetical protein
VGDAGDVDAVDEQDVDDGVGGEHAGGGDGDGSDAGDLADLAVDGVAAPDGGEVDPDVDHRGRPISDHRLRRAQQRRR